VTAQRPANGAMECGQSTKQCRELPQTSLALSYVLIADHEKRGRIQQPLQSRSLSPMTFLGEPQLSRKFATGHIPTLPCVPRIQVH